MLCMILHNYITYTRIKIHHLTPPFYVSPSLPPSQLDEAMKLSGSSSRAGSSLSLTSRGKEKPNCTSHNTPLLLLSSPPGSQSLHGSVGSLHRYGSFHSFGSRESLTSTPLSALPHVYHSAGGSQDRLNTFSRLHPHKKRWSSQERLKLHLQPQELSLLASKGRSGSGRQLPPEPAAASSSQFYTPVRSRKPFQLPTVNPARSTVVHIHRSASFNSELSPPYGSLGPQSAGLSGVSFYRTTSDGPSPDDMPPPSPISPLMATSSLSQQSASQPGDHIAGYTLSPHATCCYTIEHNNYRIYFLWCFLHCIGATNNVEGLVADHSHKATTDTLLQQPAVPGLKSPAMTLDDMPTLPPPPPPPKSPYGDDQLPPSPHSPPPPLTDGSGEGVEGGDGEGGEVIPSLEKIDTLLASLELQKKRSSFDPKLLQVCVF